MAKEKLKFLDRLLCQSLFVENNTQVGMRFKTIRFYGKHLAVFLNGLVKFSLRLESIGKI